MGLISPRSKVTEKSPPEKLLLQKITLLMLMRFQIRNSGFLLRKQNIKQRPNALVTGIG